MNTYLLISAWTPHFYTTSFSHSLTTVFLFSCLPHHCYVYGLLLVTLSWCKHILCFFLLLLYVCEFIYFWFCRDALILNSSLLAFHEPHPAWTFFHTSCLPVVSLQDTVGRHLPSWGGSWAKLCQRLIGSSLLMMTHLSGNWKKFLFFTLFKSFKKHSAQMHSWLWLQWWLTESKKKKSFLCYISFNDLIYLMILHTPMQVFSLAG